MLSLEHPCLLFLANAADGLTDCSCRKMYTDFAIEAITLRLVPGMDRDHLPDALLRGAVRNAADCGLWGLETKRRRADVWDLARVLEPHHVITTPVALRGKHYHRHGSIAMRMRASRLEVQQNRRCPRRVFGTNTHCQDFLTHA